MGVGILNPWTFKPFFQKSSRSISCLTEKIRGIAGKMTAFYQNRGIQRSRDGFGRLQHILFCFNFSAAENFRFGNIGRNYRPERKKRGTQGFQRVIGQQPAAAGRNHDRIDDNVFRLVFPKFLRDGLNDFGIGYHADFYRVRRDIRKNTIQLSRHKIGRGVDYPVNACCILGSESGDGAHGIHFVSSNGFDVCLNSGASAGVRTGDC